MENALIPFSELNQFAQAVAKSQLFGVKTVEHALGLMLIAQSEGRHPGTVARDYHIIQGRPSLKADTILSRFQESGGTVSWDEYSDKRACGTFTHPKGGSVTIDWTMERAQKAGLAGKDTWKAYGRAMLRARVISEAVRTIYPVVMCGMLATEEAEDIASVPALPEPQQRQQPVVTETTFTEQAPAQAAIAAPAAPAPDAAPRGRGRPPKAPSAPVAPTAPAAAAPAPAKAEPEQVPAESTAPAPAAAAASNDLW